MLKKKNKTFILIYIRVFNEKIGENSLIFKTGSISNIYHFSIIYMCEDLCDKARR